MRSESEKKELAESTISIQRTKADAESASRSGKNPKHQLTRTRGAKSITTKSALKAERMPSTKTTAKAEKVVCRYCGSDDLSPSFIKRRDARCRACFKKRYGSSARSSKPRTGKGAKASK
jgi:hypothetical protein